MRNAGTIYLLHFERPICDTRPARHYLGWAKNLDARLTEHRNGTGARLPAAAAERGIGFTVAATWPGDRHLERRLKNRKNAPHFCPCCREDPKR